MKLNLSSDGGVTAFLELRAKGSNFSQNLSPETTVIATNGLDPNSDRHWAVNGLYRRSVHLLNDGTELQAVNDTWDFATASKFPVKGCVAEVADIRTIRGSIPVYRIRVEREQAEYIDLYFQDHVPSWKSPDIWVDWQGDNPDSSVRPGCSNDSGFLLTAWRRAGKPTRYGAAVSTTSVRDSEPTSNWCEAPGSKAESSFTACCTYWLIWLSTSPRTSRWSHGSEC